MVKLPSNKKVIVIFAVSLVSIVIGASLAGPALADPIGKPCTLPSGKAGTTSGNGNCTATDGSGETGPAGAGPLTPAAGNQVVRVPDAVNQSSVGTVDELVKKVITFLGWVIGVVSVLGILIGSLLYIVSAGDPNKTRVAKDALVYSVVGLIVAMLAYSIVTFILGRVS